MVNQFQKVMTSARLDVHSKAIYSFMVAFNDDCKVIATVADICGYLGISKRTFYKYRQPLVSLGYLRLEYINNEDYHGNVYHL